MAAVVLAAGTSSRFRASGFAGPTKLVSLVDGQPLVRHAARAALLSRARPVIVVTGHASDAVREALAGVDVAFAHNAGFATGLAGSLQTGLLALPPTADAALVLLADMPDVRRDTLDALIAAFAAEPGLDAAAPVRAGRRGNPVLLGRPLFARALRLSGDEGARRLLAGARIAEVPVTDAGVVVDIDELSDVRTRETLRSPHRG